jgi:prevent-host-death family protein
MQSVGVRELKAQASTILRRIQARGEAVEITHRGKTVARLVPVTPSPRPRRGGRVWSELDGVAAEIGARWPRGRSARAAVREGRRDL